MANIVNQCLISALFFRSLMNKLTDFFASLKSFLLQTCGSSWDKLCVYFSQRLENRYFGGAIRNAI